MKIPVLVIFRGVFSVKLIIISIIFVPFTIMVKLYIFGSLFCIFNNRIILATCICLFNFLIASDRFDREYEAFYTYHREHGEVRTTYRLTQPKVDTHFNKSLPHCDLNIVFMNYIVSY